MTGPFYSGGEDMTSAGWGIANQLDDSDSPSLKSKVMRAAKGGLKDLSKPSPESPQSALTAVQAPPPPAPYVPQGVEMAPMGSQMSPARPRNPRLQQAMLEA